MTTQTTLDTVTISRIHTATFDVAGEQRRVQIVDVWRLRDGKLAGRWASS